VDVGLAVLRQRRFLRARRRKTAAADTSRRGAAAADVRLDELLGVIALTAFVGLIEHVRHGEIDRVRQVELVVALVAEIDDGEIDETVPTDEDVALVELVDLVVVDDANLARAVGEVLATGGLAAVHVIEAGTVESVRPDVDLEARNRVDHGED